MARIGSDMITLKNILCPTDFSELSVCAIEYARSFAEAYSARLHLLHVVDEAYQYWMAMGPNSIPIGPPPDELIAAGQEGMKKFVAAHLPTPPTELVADVRLGRPFLEIIRYARETPADLIILGTHGRSGLSHVLLGSVTEKVVRKAPCPVLTVRHPTHTFEMP